MGTAKRQKRPAQPRRSFSARARRAAALAAQGHSRKEIAVIIGVAPETISVWKRHRQWQLEVERCRALAEAPVELRQSLLQRQSLAAAREALEQLGLIMERATKQVRTGAGLQEVPDWSTRRKPCALVLANFFALYWLLLTGEGKSRDPWAYRVPSREARIRLGRANYLALLEESTYDEGSRVRRG